MNTKLLSVGGTENNFFCKGRYSHPIKCVVVLSKKQSPTRDLYLNERLKAARVPVYYWSLGEPLQFDLDGAYVIVVRYIDGPAMSALTQARKALAGVAYLLDDDIQGAWRDQSLPKHYRFLMAHFWWRWHGLLEELSSELWLSSDMLARQYNAGERIDPIVTPFPLPRDRQANKTDTIVKIAYHGSKTHRADLLWLRDIIAEVQTKCSHTEVEIVGDRKAKKWFRGIPRTKTLGVLPWQVYCNHVSNKRVDIGLVALLDTPFNRCRSWNKYLDVAKWGAVGVFSKFSNYAAVVEHEINGLLISNNDPQAWVDAIVRLSNDKAYRHGLMQNIDMPHNVQTPLKFGELSH